MGKGRGRGGVGGVREGWPQGANLAPERGGQREEPVRGLAPASRALTALFMLAVDPPDMTAGHLLVDIALAGGDRVGEERQGVALAALLAEERRAFARRLPIGGWARPATEAHHTSSRLA